MSGMDTLLSMKVFRQVVESGSFVGAAERLSLSTAMTSKHLMHLEKHEEDRALVNAAGASYTLSELRFQSGVDAYLTVLDSQRTLYNAQQGLVSVELTRLQSQVDLYKALGGGWQENVSRAALRPDNPLL
jgi:DNA-binding transcriptional LysR family regulator